MCWQTERYGKGNGETWKISQTRNGWFEKTWAGTSRANINKIELDWKSLKRNQSSKIDNFESRSRNWYS